MSKRILSYLGIDVSNIGDTQLDLSVNNLLIYPSVKAILKLEFEINGYYAPKSIYKVKLNFDEYVELYIRNCLDTYID